MKKLLILASIPLASAALSVHSDADPAAAIDIRLKAKARPLARGQANEPGRQRPLSSLSLAGPAASVQSGLMDARTLAYGPDPLGGRSVMTSSGLGMTYGLHAAPVPEPFTAVGLAMGFAWSARRRRSVAKR